MNGNYIAICMSYLYEEIRSLSLGREKLQAHQLLGYGEEEVDDTS